MTIQEHEQELADLAIFFQTATFPPTPFALNKYMTITGDPRVMIEMKISTIQRFKGNDIVRDSLFKHLRELKALCESQSPAPSSEL
jgi:hypothetical protein